MHASLLIIAATLPLAACDVHKTGKHDASVTINASENGSVAYEGPGVKGSLQVEPVMLKQSNMEIDGVKMFPGSNFTAVNVQDNAVTMGFSAPAKVAVVKDYYAKRFAEEGVTVTPSIDGFVGKTKDGGDFTLGFVDKGEATAVTKVVHDKE